MTVRPLTNTEVKNAKCRGKDYSLHDGFGLLLYVSKAGGKSWRFRYVHPVKGKRQTFTIGRFPEFTLAEAREERERLRRMVARGIDPNEVKKEERLTIRLQQAQTFKNISSEWLKRKEKTGITKGTFKANQILINHINSFCGDMPLHQLTAPFIIEKLNAFGDRLSVVNGMITCINSVMGYAINIGMVSSNPLSNIRAAFSAPKRNPRPALAKSDFPEFMKKWYLVNCSEPIKQALIFQILTMVRPAEAYEARWDEISIEKQLWVIPESRMKERKEHQVPLSSQAIEVLTLMKRWRKNEFVFPSLTKALSSIDKSTPGRLLRTSGYKNIVVPHGFRSLASTVLNEEGFNPDVIESALSHCSGDPVRNIYNRTSYFEKRKIMMQWWGDFVDSAKSGALLETSGDKGLRVIA